MKKKSKQVSFISLSIYSFHGITLDKMKKKLSVYLKTISAYNKKKIKL